MTEVHILFVYAYYSFQKSEVFELLFELPELKLQGLSVILKHFITGTDDLHST